MKKISKILKLTIYDFDKSRYAYAIQTNKNMFGYKSQSTYKMGDKPIYTGVEYDNVESLDFYWVAFGLSPNQHKSLIKKIKKIQKHEKLISSIENEFGISEIYSNGSSIDYIGDNTANFKNKILNKAKQK